MYTSRTWRRTTPDHFWPQAADANIEHPPQAATNPQPNPNNNTRRPNTVTGFPRHFKFTKAADGAETCRNYNTGKACPNPCVFANVCVSCGGNHRDRDWTGKK